MGDIPKMQGPNYWLVLGARSPKHEAGLSSCFSLGPLSPQCGAGLHYGIVLGPLSPKCRAGLRHCIVLGPFSPKCRVGLSYHIVVGPSFPWGGGGFAPTLGHYLQVKHCLDFSFVFSAPLPAEGTSQPVTISKK